MLKLIFKNKLSVLGTFIIICSVGVIFYNINKFQNLVVISQNVKNVYTQTEKKESEFKYGKTNLNTIYLYIETHLNNIKFYTYENIGNDIESQHLEKIKSELPIGSKISIWVDKNEINNYKDVEIQRLEINHEIIINNSISFLYIIIAIFIGSIFLFISKKYT